MIVSTKIPDNKASAGAYVRRLKMMTAKQLTDRAKALRSRPGDEAERYAKPVLAKWPGLAEIFTEKELIRLGKAIEQSREQSGAGTRKTNTDVD